MKRLFLSTASLLVTLACMAQLNLGAKIGYNSSLGFDNISSVNSGDYDLSAIRSDFGNGGHIGLFARIGTKVYFQPELLYCLGSKTYNVVIGSGTESYTYRKKATTSTIDVPLLIGYKVMNLKVANLRLFAGPRLKFNAGSVFKYSNLSEDISTDDLKDNIKSAKLGFDTGIGVDVANLTFDLGYNFAGKMYGTKVKGYSIDNGSSGNGFVFSVGVKFF